LQQVRTELLGRNVHEIIKKDTKEPEDQTEDTDSIELFYQVSSISKVNFPDMWLKELTLEGKNNIVFKLDTGAQVNILPPIVICININAYGGGKIKTLFKTKFKVFCNMSSKEIEFIVADVKGQLLLGLAGCLKLLAYTSDM
jgi:hypothetical protein